MNEKRIMMFVMVIVYALVLRFYFFTELRNALHFGLGVAITVMLISRYRNLKDRQHPGKAQYLLIISYVVIFTLYIWYIQPMIAGWIA